MNQNKDDEQLYKVVWVAEGTEYQGEGSPLPKKLAEQAAAMANREYPDITHKAVPVKK